MDIVANDFEDMIDREDPTWEFSDEEPTDMGGDTFSDVEDTPMLFTMPGNKEFRGTDQWKITKRGSTTPKELQDIFNTWKKTESKKEFDWATVEGKLDVTIVEKLSKSTVKRKDALPPKVSLAAIDSGGKTCVVFESAEHGRFLVCSILKRMHGPPTAAALSRKANAIDDYNEDEVSLEAELGAPYPDKYGARLGAKDRREKKEKAPPRGKGKEAVAPPTIEKTDRSATAAKPVPKMTKATPKKQPGVALGTALVKSDPKGKSKPKAATALKPEVTATLEKPAEMTKPKAKPKPKAKVAASPKPKAKAKAKRLFSDVTEGEKGATDDEPKEPAAGSPIAAIVESLAKAGGSAEPTENDGENPQKKIKLLSEAVELLSRGFAAALQAHGL